VGGGGGEGTIKDRARTWRTQYARNETALGGEPWEGWGGEKEGGGGVGGVRERGARRACLGVVLLVELGAGGHEVVHFDFYCHVGVLELILKSQRPSVLS
jgi:hypothetical protein